MTQTLLDRQVLEQAACKCLLFPFTCEAKEIGDVYMQASPWVFNKISSFYKNNLMLMHVL